MPDTFLHPAFCHPMISFFCLLSCCHTEAAFFITVPFMFLHPTAQSLPVAVIPVRE